MDEEISLLRDENYDLNEKPTIWYYFEAMDRTSMLMRYLDDALCNHPGLSDLDARRAQEAMNSLMEIYQSVGAKYFDLVEEEERKKQ